MLNIDWHIRDEGSIVLFEPLSDTAHEWLEDTINTEPWQYFGNALAVDHRMAQDLYDLIVEEFGA